MPSTRREAWTTSTNQALCLSVKRAVTDSKTPDVLLAELLLDRTRGPLTPEWEVVRAHAQGRVLHFNGAACYILNTDGTLTVTETSGPGASRMQVFPSWDEWAKGYIRSNQQRPASVLDALHLAELFGLFTLSEFYEQ